MDYSNSDNETNVLLVVQRFRRLKDTYTRLQSITALAHALLLEDKTNPSLRLFASLLSMIIEEYEQENVATTSDV